MGALVIATSLAAAAVGAGTASAVPSTWTIKRGPERGDEANQILSVSCPSTTFCMAVGYANVGAKVDTLAMSGTGTTWHLTLPSRSRTGYNNYLLRVACASATSCFAVGYSQATQIAGAPYVPLSERWDGVRWRILSNPQGIKHGFLTSIACPGPSLCFAVGQWQRPQRSARAVFERWSGAAWTVVTTPGLTPAAASNIACPTTTECITVGAAIKGPKRPIVQMWNGTDFTTMAVPKVGLDDALNSVSCASASSCTAVGDYYDTGRGQHLPLVEAWDGTTWTVQTITAESPNQSLQDVSCASPTDCVAVGTFINGKQFQNLLVSWDGTAWSVLPIRNLSHTINSLLTVACPSTSTCTALGADGHGAGESTVLSGT